MKHLLKTVILSFVFIFRVPFLQGMDSSVYKAVNVISSSVPAFLMLYPSYYKMHVKSTSNNNQEEQEILSQIEKNISGKCVIKNEELGFLYRNIKKILKNKFDISYDSFEKCAKCAALLIDKYNNNNVCFLVKELLIPSANLLQLHSLRIQPIVGNLVYIQIAPYLLINNTDLRNTLIQFDSQVAYWHQQNQCSSKLIFIKGGQILGLQTINIIFWPLISESLNNLWTSDYGNESLKLAKYISGFIGSTLTIKKLGEYAHKKLIKDKISEVQKENLLNSQEIEKLKILFKEEIKNLSTDNFEQFFLKVQTLEQFIDALIERIPMQEKKKFSASTYTILQNKIDLASFSNKEEILDSISTRLQEKHFYNFPKTSK